MFQPNDEIEVMSDIVIAEQVYDEILGTRSGCNQDLVMDLNLISFSLVIIGDNSNLLKMN